MIRPMEERDSAAVQVICSEALGFKASPELILGNIRKLKKSPGHTLWVFEEQERVLGFLHAQDYENLYTEAGVNLLALAVLPSEQGKGIGKTMMAAIEAEALQKGSFYLRINSREARSDAHRFYESLGYVCETLQKRYMKALRAKANDGEGM